MTWTICPREKCVGCGACANVCPKNAISLVPDKRGFLHPQIDENLCVKCSLCQKKCPVNNPVPGREIISVVGGWNRNQGTRKASTSGGVFSLLASCILKQGGAVVGVRWNDSFEPEHFMATSENEIEYFRGSKYVQSRTGMIYVETKKVLETGRKVLFSGTPCQIHALRLVLGKEYPNLFIVDLVCHGVPSYAFFYKHLNEVSKSHPEHITGVYLRRKDPCWDYSSVHIDFEGGQSYQELTMNDPYFCLFNKGYSLRESCHYCRYTNLQRVSDITLSDFWNYRPDSFKTRHFAKGISCILVNSDKGQALIKEIEPQLISKPSSIKKALKANKSLSEPFPFLPDNDSFWLDYENGVSIEKLKEKYMPGHFSIPKSFWIKRWIKGFLWLSPKK